MEILAVKLQQIDHPFASGKVWQMTVQTNYEPAEIIVIRPDGTSESTDPEALHKRQKTISLTVINEYLRGRAELEPEVASLKTENERLKAALSNITTLQSEIDAGRVKQIERLKSELECSNGDFRQLEAMKESLESELKCVRECRAEDVQRLRAEVLEAQEARDQLKRELGEMHSAIAEPAAREAVQRVLHGVRPDLRLQGEVLRLETLRNVRLALGCPGGDVVSTARKVVAQNESLISELDQIGSVLKPAHGMTLDEVRGLKAERDGLKSTEASRLRQLEYARQGRDEAQEKLRKTGFILGADMRLSGCVTQAAANIVEDLTRTKRRLETSLQGECDLRNMVHGLTAKLEAVTRALSG